MLILPNGRPSNFARESLSRDDIALIERFEAWLTRRNLRMDLLCQHCIDEGLHPRVSGDNRRDSAEYKIVCAHAERVYGVPITEH